MILVTGSNGQLGSELKELLSDSEAIFVNRSNCDITNIESLNKTFSKYQINAVINCAAYTNVDKAESEFESAYAINHIAVKNLALICKKKNISLIHISTDYVFDGKANIPLTEDMAVGPISMYGKSKLAGENEILSISPTAVIIRTSWLYSGFGNNFVKSMIKYGNERDELNIVYDQVGTPTNAADLAAGILKIIPQIKDGECEVYHYANEGVCSWFDFTKTIHEEMNISCHVLPITTDMYPTPATRPSYSVLNKKKIKDKFNIEIPYWKESLKRCLKKRF